MGKYLSGFLRSAFAKGVLCGVIAAVIFCVSWRLVVFLGGLWLLYYIFKSKQ